MKDRVTENYTFCGICNNTGHVSAAHEENKPVDVVLRFKNVADRDYFLGQMSDGFGEGLPLDFRRKKDGTCEVTMYSLFNDPE